MIGLLSDNNVLILAGGGGTIRFLNQAASAELGHWDSSSNLVVGNNLNVGGVLSVGPGAAFASTPGDISANRNNGSGYVFLANSNHYIGFDSTNYQLPTSGLVVGGGIQIPLSANFNMGDGNHRFTTDTSNNLYIVTWYGGGSIQFYDASGGTAKAIHNSSGFESIQRIYAMWDWGGALGNMNAFLAPNIGDNRGQALAQSWGTWSSGKHKRNVRPICEALALVRDDRLRGVYYDNVNHRNGYDDDAVPETTPCLGFVADEWRERVPEIVLTDADGDTVGMDYSRVAAILWEAVKALSVEVDQLKREARVPVFAANGRSHV